LAFYREVEHAKRTGEDRFGHIFALALSTTAGLLILGSEFFFILDTFNGRMNTIFKLYYQAWLMLSVAGGFVLFEITHGWRMPSLSAPKTSTETASNGNRPPMGEIGVATATFVGAVLGIALIENAPGSAGLLNAVIGLVVGAGVFFVVSGASLLWWRSSPSENAPATASRITWRGVWAGAAATLLFGAFMYPMLATYYRTNGFHNHQQLDGLASLPPAERSAIDWLRDRDGHPVVVEAPGGDYSYFGTISAATGLPTILQWKFHEVQWRGTSKGLDEREQAVETLYTSSDAAQVQSVIQQYNVRYVVVGPKEREKYPNLDIEQMTDMFQMAKQDGDVTVYRVAPGILGQVNPGGGP
jgi:uncharacterized membrane protein